MVLREHGLADDPPDVHLNSFLIRRALFRTLGGYDERFCGQYGGDDVDFQERYRRLCDQGRARPAELIGEAYTYPDPARDRAGLFHRLERTQTPAVAAPLA